jgi:uncharacterized OsmC-like protein
MRVLLISAGLLMLGGSHLPGQGTMTLISPELGQKFLGLRQRLALASTAEDLVSNTADVRLTRDQRSEAKVRGFTLIQDEPESAWGTGTGPTPTDYFIASVGFCENVIFARSASMEGLSVDSLETNVRGTWDRRGLFEIGSVAPSFKTITVETRVSTRDSVEKVVEVARQTHRRCPVHATLSRSTDLRFTLVVNGRNVPLEAR